MPELTKQGLKSTGEWRRKNIEIPSFDLDMMISNTEKSPQWIHFGAGNIFRGFVAELHQQLLNLGKAKTGILAAEAYDEEIITKTYAPYDNLTLLVIMRGDGTFEKKVVASVADGLIADPSLNDWKKLQVYFSKESLQMVSFTITEKGYSLRNLQGEFFDFIKEDLKNGPAFPQSAMAKLCSLMYERYKAGGAPIALVSMDNCSHNGDKLYAGVSAIAGKWEAEGLADKGFLAYINDRQRVSFPLSMIDKITPSPSPKVRELLEADQVAGMEIIRTTKNSNVAPFVNAEKAQYLVIEDWFPNGRMPLEDAGVYFTDRETVDRVEKMKVCTCLNPLHTALAVFGCILGFQSISSEMEDADLKALVEKIGYVEGLPVVVNPGIIDPKDFIDVVIGERLPNPNMPDTPQRIACDTSQKVGIRFGETLKAYCERADLDVTKLTYIPLAIAGWCRYLLGKDDNWNSFDLSPDPMLGELTGYLKEIQLGGDSDAHKALFPILSNDKLFGVDLYAIGLGEKIEAYFVRMISEKGAVRSILQQCETITGNEK